MNSASDGSYVLATLPLGPYQLEVSKEGFTKSVESGIVLQVNSDPAVDIGLRVGALTEQVQVEALAEYIRADRGSDHGISGSGDGGDRGPSLERRPPVRHLPL